MPSVCPKNWSQRDAGPNGAQPKSLAAPHFRFFGQILSLTKWNCAGIVVRAAFAVCLLCGSFDAVCQAQADAANSASQSPDLQEIVTLSRQHMDDSVITNYISSSGKTYKLGADDIIYLNSQGVSQGVISALLRATGPARSNLPPPITPTTNSPVTPAVTAASPQPPPLDPPASPTIIAQVTSPAPPVAAAVGSPGLRDDSFAGAQLNPTPTLDYFQPQLAPYGNWITVPGYGLCWEPIVASGWRPYFDGGHWEYTDAGWYWQSDYPWGDIPFHYGRWVFANLGPAPGWVWKPGFDYAPAWVVWRHADDEGYVGWAPLPPGAVFVDGNWEFNHVRVGVDFTFGLGDAYFTFVDYGHLFFDPHFYPHGYRQFVPPRDRLALIFQHSVVENHYRLDHGRFVNDGLPRDRMAELTHHEIRPAGGDELRRQEEQRNALTRRDAAHTFRPGPNQGHP